MIAKARLETRGVDFGAAAPKVHLRQQMVRCGKDSCTRCPHGPYWYAYWTEDGKRRSRYVGKIDEESVNPAGSSSERGMTSHSRGGR
jgi:hypothetical protein